MQYSQSSPKMTVNADNGEASQTIIGSSFEYTGNKALTVKGSITGTQYQFSCSGNRQNIDPRDIPGIINIPVLRRV